MGFQPPSAYCCRTAAAPMPEASIAMEVSASGEGKPSIETSPMAFLAVRKASSATVLS